MDISAERLLGVGCDTEERARLAEVLARRPGFLDRWFLLSERTEQHAAVDATTHALCQFCLKEAAIKACWSHVQLTPSSIEVLLEQDSLRILHPAAAGIRLEWRLHRSEGHAEAEVLAWLPTP